MSKSSTCKTFTLRTRKFWGRLKYRPSEPQKRMKTSRGGPINFTSLAKVRPTGRPSSNKRNCTTPYFRVRWRTYRSNKSWGRRVICSFNCWTTSSKKDQQIVTRSRSILYYSETNFKASTGSKLRPPTLKRRWLLTLTRFCQPGSGSQVTRAARRSQMKNLKASKPTSGTSSMIRSTWLTSSDRRAVTMSWGPPLGSPKVSWRKKRNRT